MRAFDSRYRPWPGADASGGDISGKKKQGRGP